MKLVDPGAVGVPDIVPDDAEMVRPGGKVLPDASAHEYGEVPPVALNEAEYATLICPWANEEVEIESDEVLFTVMDNAAVACLAGAEESVTCTEKDEVPVEAGIPEIIPVVGAKVSPEGRVEPETRDQV